MRIILFALAVLFGSGSLDGQSFPITVNNGHGSGFYEAGDTVFIYARVGANDEAFNGWSYSDETLIFLADEREWWSSFIMPARAITATARFTSIPSDLLTFESIDAAENAKPVYWAYPPNAIGTIFFFHGTGGSAEGWVQPNRDQRYAIVKEAYAAGFGVIISESEESTLGRDLNGDDKIRWQGYPIDTLHNIDYQNMKILIDTFVQRGLLDRSRLYSIGMSNGGSFSGTFSLAFDTQASAVYCASSQTAIANNTDAALLFCLMPNDATIGEEGNTDALANHERLLNRGGCSRYFMNSAMPIYPAIFERVGLAANTSEAIFEELQNNDFLGDNNYLLLAADALQAHVQQTPQAWPTLSGIPGRAKIDVANLINMATGEHVYYASHNQRTLTFLTDLCDITTATEEVPDKLAHTLRAFPNPTTGEITMEGLDGVFPYRIFNAAGQQLGSGVSINNQRLALPEKPGAYLIQVEKHGQYYTTLAIKLP